MFRRMSLGVLAGAMALTAAAQDTQYPPRGQQIPAPECMNLHYAWEGPTQPPCTAFAHERWLRDLQHWRTERRIRTAYDPSRYELPALRWTQSSFIQPQMMVQDRFLYDPVAGRYTVDRYLDDLDKRYGGIDAVLVWSTYPNMGIDDRNQLEMVESMPGGVDGVRQMVADFHRRGVRVLFPMMMWDEGTHQPSQPWPDAIAALMKQIDADGVNGDTQDGVPLGFSLAAERIDHPLAFQPEVSPSDEALAWNVMTWGQYNFPFIPMADRFKWLETRHMVNISDRWNLDKTADLQFAFFNGVGWESWENVWGIWIGINPRDAEATRHVATIERAVAPFLVSPDWEPLYPMHNYGVYASRWPLGQETVWTIVNRNVYDIAGRQMDVPLTPGMRYFDLYRGVELKLEADGDKAVLSFDLEANGYGAILATPGEPSEAIKTLMRRMAAMTTKLLTAWSHEPDSIETEPGRNRCHKARYRDSSRHGKDSRRAVCLQGARHGDRGRRLPRRRCPVPVGRLASPLPREGHAGGSVLHRQVPGNQRAVQGVSGRHPLRALRQGQLPARLEGRDVSARLGEPARDLGLA